MTEKCIEKKKKHNILPDSYYQALQIGIYCAKCILESSSYVDIVWQRCKQCKLLEHPATGCYFCVADAEGCSFNIVVEEIMFQAHFVISYNLSFDSAKLLTVLKIDYHYSYSAAARIEPKTSGSQIKCESQQLWMLTDRRTSY